MLKKLKMFLKNRNLPLTSLGKIKLDERFILSNPSNDRSRFVVGYGSYLAGEFYIWFESGEILIGNDVFVGPDTRIYSSQRIIIGDRVQIAHGCNIFDNDIHSANPGDRHREFISNSSGSLRMVNKIPAATVVIEDDVWIGTNVTIMKGVTIGKGAIVAPNSVVVNNVPSMVLAAGVPTHNIRKIVL